MILRSWDGIVWIQLSIEVFIVGREQENLPFPVGPRILFLGTILIYEIPITVKADFY